MNTTNFAEPSVCLPPLSWAGVQSRLDIGIAQAPGSGGPSRRAGWLTTPVDYDAPLRFDPR